MEKKDKEIQEGEDVASCGGLIETTFLVVINPRDEQALNGTKLLLSPRTKIFSIITLGLLSKHIWVY